jgi:hypothetical protein
MTQSFSNNFFTVTDPIQEFYEMKAGEVSFLAIEEAKREVSIERERKANMIAHYEDMLNSVKNLIDTNQTKCL